MDDRYSTYRQIRAQRTWRPLGRMTWWRIVLGIALLLLVLMIAGIPSRYLAAGGHYRAAEKWLLFPSWMEQYLPDTKALIDAGALYENGDESAALAILQTINPSDLSEGEALEYERLLSVMDPDPQT